MKRTKLNEKKESLLDHLRKAVNKNLSFIPKKGKKNGFDLFLRLLKKKKKKKKTMSYFQNKRKTVLIL